MGIDFNNLIKTLGAKAASVSGKADKIDSKQELKEYVSGWDKIKADAKSNSEKSGIVDLQAQAQTQAEIDALAKAELNEIMGLDFAKKDLNIQKKVDIQKGAAFSDEDISLENLMSLLDNDVDALTDAGFEQELLNELIDVEPGAIKYMSNAIKDGSAKRISDNIEEMKKDIKGARNVMNAMSELLGNDIMSMAPSYSETKATSDKSTFDEITEFREEDNK